MNDADPGVSLQASTRSAPTHGGTGANDRPPRYHVRRPVPRASSPGGIAHTVASLIALPIRVVLELGVETLRTLGAAFSARQQDR